MTSAIFLTCELGFRVFGEPWIFRFLTATGRTARETPTLEALSNSSTCRRPKATPPLRKPSSVVRAARKGERRRNKSR